MAFVIVIGNEKGGAGKSTVATHLVGALMQEDASVSVIDLDVRQRSTARFFENRRAWAADRGVEIAHPFDVTCAATPGELSERLEKSGDIVIIDTPGSDTEAARAAHQAADLVLTPMNDSFVDLDVLGVVDPVSLDVVRPSIYAETVWNARKARAAAGRGQIDWVVVRNRLAPVEARNRRRVDDKLAVLAKRVGFRTVAGLRDRVIYRELAPFGLTVSDLSRAVRPVKVSMGHIVARQELRMLMHELGLTRLATAAE